MKETKYKNFYFWENLIRKKEVITSGYFRGFNLTRNSIFLNTVIVNYNTGILYDWWICYPNISATLGFIQNVFLISAFDAFLLPEQETVCIVTGTLGEFLEVAKDNESMDNKDYIPEMEEFADMIEKIWNADEEALYEEVKNYSEKYNRRWGKKNTVFSYFHVFNCAEEVGRYIIKDYERENMISYFTEDTGLTKEQWEEIYLNVYENEFLRKRFMDILNHKK